MQTVKTSHQKPPAVPSYKCLTAVFLSGLSLNSRFFKTSSGFTLTVSTRDLLQHVLSSGLSLKPVPPGTVVLLKIPRGLGKMFKHSPKQRSLAVTIQTHVWNSAQADGVCAGCRCAGQNSFDGSIYNLRLWDYAMTVQDLSSLSCDRKGNVIDWDNSHWSIPSTLAQTDATLSCSEYRTQPDLRSVTT